MLDPKRKEQLLNQKTLTISEVAELKDCDPSNIYKKLEKYPDCLNLEGKPIRIINDRKMRRFNPDLRINRMGYQAL